MGQRRNLKEFDADIHADLLWPRSFRHRQAQKAEMDHSLSLMRHRTSKTAATAQSKAVRSLKADTHIAMSGTPVENRLSEYWSIMDFANKGYLGTIKAFNNDYARPIQQEGNTECAERFRRITAPLMMRRLKTDKSIINDLPDKIEQDEFALLTPQQAAIYKKVIEESMKVIENIDEDDNKQLFKRQGLILQMMLALETDLQPSGAVLSKTDRPISPALSGKAEMLLDLVSAIERCRREGHHLHAVQGDGRPAREVHHRCHRVSDPMFLHGGCTLKQRKEMVDRFQRRTAQTSFFILSLKAAGTGLNLTAATHVIHYDLWWNPCRGGPGHRPRLPHRPASERDGPPLHHQATPLRSASTT
jgi:phosphoribosyl-ATP pyrophosphohydrolase